MDIPSIIDRIAARGQQTRRKDKDLMVDTGGSSKGRDKEPTSKPSRDDLKSRYRDRRLTPDKIDNDTNEDKDREVKKPSRRPQASNEEKEVERLLKDVLRGTSFANRVFAVGGYVRDEVMGLEAKDLDIVIEQNGGAEKLTKHIFNLFPGAVSTPRQMQKYPIWVIAFKSDVEYKGETYATKGAEIEVADSQKESFPDEKSRERVTEPGTLSEDTERRDFTVNMLLKDLTTGELRDMTGTSINDIEKGILRGHPGVDFSKILRDDPLRMIRLVRFQAKYGWSVPLSVIKIVRANAERINIVSGERIRDELVKVMKLGKLAQAVKFMKVLGLLQHVFPEIQAMIGTKHDKKNHQEGDVFNHTMLVLRNAKPGIENQLAALLHDVGKPATQEIVGEAIRFYGHETVGGEIAEAIMRRLRFEKDTIRDVRKMVEMHMRPHSLMDSGPKALRKFVRDVGQELVDAVLDLAEADSLGTLPPENLIPRLGEIIQEVQKETPATEKPPLSGGEIMQLLGLKAGPEVGTAKKMLQDRMDEYAGTGKAMTKEEASQFLLDNFPKG